MFSRDVKAFKIFPRKLPPTYWCPFKARLFCNLHYKTCLWRTIKLPNCLNMQILVILLLKKRYTQKIAYIGIDSCLISDKNYNGECLPPIESIDLISYLVLETSYYTKEPSRVFKHITTCSLDLNRVFTDSKLLVIRLFWERLATLKR